ncbi:MAG TPA: DNA methyltransferase [Gemmatimonadaceae bacterium]|nr:DNA methyltransferase [Gemmatimonadaceae bacterium]
MARVPPELYAHREWLGQLQQVGLVVSPQVLIDNGVFVDRQKSIDAQVHLRALLSDSDSTSQISRDAAIDLLALTRDVLEWPDGLLAGGPGGSPLPDTLTIALPEYNDTLSPSYALPDPGKAGEWFALVSMVPAGTDLDRAPEDHGGWRATPHARLERLLRETSVPIGLLFNGASLRLVYAPRGESSGHLTFRLAHLGETLGRPMMGALYALLGAERVTDVSLEQQRLPYLLRESRKYQNKVSTELAGQVLEALWELLRGLQRGNEESKGTLLAEVLRERPGDVYGGLLTTMMRLVFILYAEDRGLMPAGDVYQRHYSISGLFERLREDQARYPDTMDARFGAWAQLLVLFRLIHDGGGHGNLRFPSRHGRLFDPDAYPFLEGRPHESHRQLGEPVEPPMISDGVVFRVLNNLLVLEGERLSYRTLDVEQIGSVYEAMMDFALQVATGPSIAVTPKHIVFNVEELLEQKPKERAAWLKEQTELKLTADLLSKAATPSDLVGALGKRVSRYTPHVMKAGDLFLQPTEERRRSGSHYTPRSLTQPIVHTTFRPIFERLGEQATPEQILDLKVCDPAMGSGAFLVEACRLLAERLVRAWEIHKSTPKVPDDEDVLTYARRLVAERCLYGVDKNIFAVDLAKLSLWLATLAREHPFTFLDHAIRHGDSLVGLSREQIACLHWAPTKQLPLIRTFIDARVAEAQKLRLEIQKMGASDDVPGKLRLLREADEAVADVRLIGDIVISAFFERKKPRDRETLRVAYAGKVEATLRVVGDDIAVASDAAVRLELRAIQDGLREGDRPVPAFHWEMEFPEVFNRENGGFDAVVGNPPFAGKNTIAAASHDRYLPWLLATHEESHGNADLVAHFYRRAFNLLRRDGAFGLIATNTIAQGDTRGTGLRWIRHHGGTIFEARRRVKWPGAAAVIVSVVHVAKGELAGPFTLDARRVELITAFLFHTGADDDPSDLLANSGKSFIGSYVLGMGFTFDDTDKTGVANPLALLHELIRKDPRNQERIFPYIGGEEVNESVTHSHHRYVINFEQMSEDEAWQWPDLMTIVEAKVKPERMRLGDNPDARHRKQFWWHWGRYTPALSEAIREFDRVLVISRVGQALAFAFCPTSRVFAESLVIVASRSLEKFTALQARPHEVWTRTLASSMKDDLRYTPSDCFETFPFPSAWESNPALERVGREYYDFRVALMARNDEGLTRTYNRFHDPDEHNSDIVKLRQMHDAMDRAVLDAYGWTDIRPNCEFILDYEDEDEDTPGKVSKRKKPWRYRWPDDIRDEVLGRLLQLNAQRAKEEALEGAAACETPRSARSEARKRSGRTPLLDGPD